MIRWTVLSKKRTSSEFPTEEDTTAIAISIAEDASYQLIHVRDSHRYHQSEDQDQLEFMLSVLCCDSIQHSMPCGNLLIL
jgi:hypothetical protein